MTNTYEVNNITREANVITINRCDHPKCVSDFLIAVKDATAKGFKEIVIRSKADAIYPNSCVPITGIIQHYQESGIEFSFDIDHLSYLHKCSFGSPIQNDREALKSEVLPFDKIFSYETSGQVADLTQLFIDCISHQCICEEGVLSGLTWCINEVMDNVLLHSEYGHGLIMAQYHPSAKHVAFCIYDCGIGIFNTLKASSHRPRTELDALSMAIQEGVGDGKGQGNGLFGLYQITKENKGRLTISSGASSIMLFSNGELRKFEHIPFVSYKNKGTIIDFQINLNKTVDIKNIFKSIGGFDGFDIRIDEMIDESDCIVYDIFKNGQGTATREAGEYIRNDIENIIKRSQSGLILDFSNVKTVSSSFIDELIAKLFLDLSFLMFNNLIRIKGMNSEIQFLCERSLYMRIHDTWKAT